MHIAAAILAIYNLAAVLTAARDKRAARTGRRRTPERSFVLLCFTGAGPGVLAAFYALRHKTKHRRLLAICWLGAALSCALLGWLFFMFFVNWDL